ncbi:hypothetical protein PsYK624_153460 [Phanerochaete sordida]|uniref:Uncharacterized protein n=1 Tax=Phanerochaete sordida TaxID=48140 RepID=A0A9P3LL73_9APHY|nr:hypothetical protein PsYK624_153460 [Phanerochaete sordida]
MHTQAAFRMEEGTARQPRIPARTRRSKRRTCQRAYDRRHDLSADTVSVSRTPPGKVTGSIDVVVELAVRWTVPEAPVRALVEDTMMAVQLQEETFASTESDVCTGRRRLCRAIMHYCPVHLYAPALATASAPFLPETPRRARIHGCFQWAGEFRTGEAL